jgi:hypothetical protein
LKWACYFHIIDISLRFVKTVEANIRGKPVSTIGRGLNYVHDTELGQ